MSRLLSIAAFPLAFLKVALEIIRDARYPPADEWPEDLRPAHFGYHQGCDERRRGSSAA